MHHSASGGADFLTLPNNAVVEMDSKIEMRAATTGVLNAGPIWRASISLKMRRALAFGRLAGFWVYPVGDADFTLKLGQGLL